MSVISITATTLQFPTNRQYELVERRDGEKSNCEGLYKVIVSQVESQLTKESCSDRAEEHTLVFSCSK